MLSKLVVSVFTAMLCTLALAQDKPESRYKPLPDKRAAEGTLGDQSPVKPQPLASTGDNEVCVTFRSVNLVEKDNKRIYRSYFLSDMGRKLIAQYCVTDKGKLHNDTTCYSIP